MNTKTRNKVSQKIIKDRLSKYLSEEQLSELDDLGIEILNDYFSNFELKEMVGSDASLVARHVQRHIAAEEQRRLSHIQPEEVEELMDWYMENCDEIEEVYDPQAEQVIALEVKHKTLKQNEAIHWDGRFTIAIGDRLFSTRSRLDKVMGYQSGLAVENPEYVEQKAAYDKAHEEAVAKHEAAVAEQQAHNDEANEDGSRKKAKELPEFVDAPLPTASPLLMPLDTRWSKPEEDVIPEEHVMSSITSSDIMNVKSHMNATGYEKPVQKVKDGYKVEQFILRKVK